MSKQAEQYKNFEQCCDEVAKNHGYKNWSEFYEFCFDEQTAVPLEESMEEAAQLFREEGIREAVKLSRRKKTY